MTACSDGLLSRVRNRPGPKGAPRKGRAPFVILGALLVVQVVPHPEAPDGPPGFSGRLVGSDPVKPS